MGHTSRLFSLIAGGGALVLTLAASFGPVGVHGAAAFPFQPPDPISHVGAVGPIPVLTGLELQPLVAPGGLVKVDGQNFGAQQRGGNLCLAWASVLVQNVYTTNNQLCLQVSDWQDNRVVAQVPSDVEGVPDQTAQVRLTTDGGQVSNGINLHFVAARDTVYLQDVINGVPLIHNTVCDEQTERDNCTSVGALHWDGFFISFGNSGTDRFHIVLANGWSMQTFTLNGDGNDAFTGTTPAAGATTIDYAVSWSVGGTTTQASYNVGVLVEGPKGVPLQ